MADNPSHYHKIDHITSAWKSYVEAVKEVAHNTVAERERAQREETKREVHNTGEPHSQKGG